MPELRKDPVIGRWVIIATERARRPGNFVVSEIQRDVTAASEDCLFCDNRGREVYSMDNVRVVLNETPVLKTNGAFTRRGHGLYDETDGYGVHEVVIETPEHIANMADLSTDQICLVLKTYVARFNELEKNTNFRYVLAYKNHENMGHSHSQIIATPVNPLNIKEKLLGAKQYFDYHERCLYCDLIRQECETQKRVVSQTEHFIAVTPFAARFPFEIWIIPKRHHCDFAQGVVGQEQDLAQMLKEILSRIKVGIDDPAYHYIIQTAPFRREESGNKWKTIQEDYHWHIELMPRLTRVAGFEKGTGFYICPIPPEDTAEFLRGVEV